MWLSVAGTSDPAVGGTGQVVTVTGSDSSSQVASAISSAINDNLSAHFTCTSVENAVTITNVANGACLSLMASGMPSGFSSSVVVAD